jgi:hypothetical protein
MKSDLYYGDEVIRKNIIKQTLEPQKPWRLYPFLPTQLEKNQ